MKTISFSNNMIFFKKKFSLFVILSMMVVIVNGQLAAWDATGLSAFGSSPFAATSLHANVSSQGIIRGAGVGTSGSAAAGGWGGNGWSATANEAISNNATVSFNIVPANNYQLSISSLSLHYRRSNTGPSVAMLQYSIAGGTYNTITLLNFTSTASTGASITPVNLQTVVALQNVQADISFRIVPYGGTNAAGTWYIYKSNLQIDGEVQPVSPGGDLCQTIGFVNAVNYTASALSSNYPNVAGLDSTEISAQAWTCNAIGFPTCNTRTLVKLDVSSIPTGTTITSARLKLFAKTNYPYASPGNPTYGSANTGLVQKIIANWRADTVTWNQAPPVNTTAQKILPQSSNTAQNYEVDITDFVQTWINHPDSNYGMLFRLQTEQYYNSLIFYAADAATPSFLRPQLVICSGIGAPVPLHLLNFSGNLLNKRIQLYWDSENEQDMDKFEIERSIDGIVFLPIGNIAAKNSSLTNHYNFNDSNFTTSNVYYRLKIYERNGHNSYSRIVSFSNVLLNGLNQFILLPNPSHSNVQLQINMPVSDKGSVRIVDAVGKVVREKNIILNKGFNSVLVSEIGKLSKGIYFVSLINGKSIQTKRLVID